MSGTDGGLAKLKIAKEFWSQGRFREAADLYRDAIAQNPDLVYRGFNVNLAHSIILSSNWREVSKVLPQGVSYLESSGWINSLALSCPVNYESKPIPWYTYPAIEFIENKLKKDFRVFEFGSGHSTLWLAGKVFQVVSVEDNSKWFSYIQEHLPENVELHFIEDEDKYTTKILNYPTFYFDVIVVDGINRNQCVEYSIDKLKKTGFIIFDNTDDRTYNEGIKLLESKGFKRIDFYGLIPSFTYKNCTSVFFKDDNFLSTGELPSEKASCLGRSCFQITNPEPGTLQEKLGDSPISRNSLLENEVTLLDDIDEWQLKIPVCLIIFNRPDTAKKVFDAIRQAKPPKLFVIADGPRANRPGEAEKCAEARAIINNKVDWDCEVLTNYADTNLGCRERVTSGLNWVFEQVEEAIIFEDDCLPHPSFFRFCEELLERYRHDERVMVISGNNFQFGRKRKEYSYYFSLYNHAWGWATWRRAWRHYDNEMKLWPQVREGNWLRDILQDEQAVNYWSSSFQEVYKGGFSVWDYRWTFACWIHNGLSILPNVNLVSNIGFGSAATHTKNVNTLANMLAEEMSFPLQHPPFVIRDTQADDFTERTLFSGPLSKPAKMPTVDLVIHQAIAQLNANNNTEALRLLEEAIAFSSDLPGLNYGKALAQARLGHTHEAVESLNRLLAAVPNHKKGKQLLAQLCTTSEREVQEMLQQAVELLNKGRKVEALRLAEKATSLGVFVPGLHYLRTVCLNAVGRHEEALEAAKQELAKNPSHAEARSQVEYLTKALLKPKAAKIPTEDRPWGTTIPHELLMSIQNATHNYAYRGVPLIKNPFDFALYPLLIWNLKPRTIIEVGSKSGGSALWFGDLLENFGIDGQIYSVDIVKVTQVSHPRVIFLEGDGEALHETFSAEFLNSLPRPLLVIEDTAHTYEISKAVLDFFHPYLEKDEYIVVEDGIISDIVKDSSYSSGPHRALKAFLADHKGEYEIDAEYCDFFGYNTTWGTNGFLKKVQNDSLETQEKPQIVVETLENEPQKTINADAEFQELLQVVRHNTRLSEAQLYSLFSLAKRVCLENIPGNFINCSVADGGSVSLMAAVIKRYSRQMRWVYAFDAFEQRLTPTQFDSHNQILTDATGEDTGTYTASETTVLEIYSKLGVSDSVRTIKGYFQDTLPKVQNTVGMIALLHMSGCSYESTNTIVHNLYERIVNDGIIQVDDYAHSQGCRQAIHEFEALRLMKFDINRIDHTAVWFFRPDKFPLNLTLEPVLVKEFAQDDPVAYGIQSQMSLNERFQLYYALRKLLPETSSPLRFIEIGSFAGSSLFLHCRTLKRTVPQLQGFAIEPGGQPQFYEVLKHLQGDVTHLRMFSHQAMPQLQQLFEQDGRLPTFIFVDGDHTYEGVKQDIIDYFPLLEPGGIMIFHDYLPPLNDENREAILFHHAGNEPGIRQACQELMENTYSCEVLDLPLLYPTDPTQTQAFLPIIPGVFSTIRAYRKPQR